MVAVVAAKTAADEPGRAGEQRVALTGRGIERRLETMPGFRREDGAVGSVGTNIRYWRRRRGMTQGQLAAAVGRQGTTVSRWETGERLPALPTLLEILVALGCDPAALLTIAEGEVGSREGNQERGRSAPVLGCRASRGGAA